MKYIFEDNGKDVYSYSKNVSSKFIYAKGAPKIESLAEPLLMIGEQPLLR